METTSPERPEQEPLGTRSEIEVLDACKRKIKAAIPAEKVRAEFDKSYRELGRTVQLPGFRPGRVPRRLLEVRFGEEIENQLKESLVGVSFGEVLEERQLKVIGAPRFDNIEYRKDADLTYEVELEVRPEFDLPAYTGVEVTREPSRVTDEDVDAQLESIREDHGKLISIDPAQATADDFYYGKYQLFREKTRVKAPEEVAFVPSRKALGDFVVEDLAERVRSWDLQSGEPLRLDVTVPAGFGDEVLRGVAARLEFQLDDVRRKELPPLDDAFAAEFGKQTLAELRDEVRQSLELRARRQEERKTEEKILEKIAAGTTIDLPQTVLEGQRRRWRSRREYELLVERGLPPEQVKEELEREGGAAEDEVRAQLKAFFVLERIADEEKIFATEEEVDDRIHLMAAYYGTSPARLREQMKESERLDDLRVQLRHEKVRKFLRKKARALGPDGRPESPEAEPQAQPAQEAPAGAAAETPGEQKAAGEEGTAAGKPSSE